LLAIPVLMDTIRTQQVLLSASNVLQVVRLVKEQIIVQFVFKDIKIQQIPPIVEAVCKDSFKILRVPLLVFSVLLIVRAVFPQLTVLRVQMDSMALLVCLLAL